MIPIILIIIITNLASTSSSPLLDAEMYEPHQLLENISFPFGPLMMDKIGIGALNLVNKIKEFYVPMPRNIENSDCKTVMHKFNTNLLDTIHSWSLKMMDSWGKFLDGFLFGNIHPVGMFEECLAIEGFVKPIGDPTIGFTGKYCTIYHEKVTTRVRRSGPGVAILDNPVPFYYATCIPSVCSDDDLQISLNKTLKSYGRKVSKLECHIKGKHSHQTDFDGFDAFVSALLILLVLLVIFGTIIDENNLKRFAVTEVGRRLLDWINCFSLTKTFKHVFSYRKGSQDAITCVHGLRVITLIWIITCHQYETAVGFLVNIFNAKKYQDPYLGQLITDGYQSVDTFFTLSGILLSYRLFPSILSGEGLTLTAFVQGYFIALFRRFMRLFPCILMVAMFCSTMIRYLGFGPRAPNVDAFAEKCRDTWWKDPLFVNNLVHEEGKSVLEDDCLDHCWYTSVEMQLFMIVPFVFLPRIYNKLAGFVWLFFLTVMSQAIPLIIMIIYEFPPVLFPYLTLKENYDFYTKYYDSPWCRSAPWFIGIWTGIILVKYPHKLKKLNKMHIIIGYGIAIILGFLLVTGLYRYNHLGKHSEISNAVSGVYGFFSRPVWAIAVSWVVITCYTKNAWYINGILSWWGWQPLSRLTFCMYLVSPVVQFWWANVIYVPVYYSYLSKLLETSGIFFISFVVAFILFALVEAPFLRMTEIASSRVLKSRASKRQQSQAPARF